MGNSNAPAAHALEVVGPPLEEAAAKTFAKVPYMMTYYLYMIACYTIAFCSRSVTYPFLIYGVYHLIIFYHIWGTGYVSVNEFVLYYTIVALLFSVLGWSLAAILNVPSIFSGERLGYSEHGILTRGMRKLESPKQAKVAWIYRVFLGLIFCVVVVASTLNFELIPFSLAPLGMICTLVCIGLSVVMFYYAFRSGGRPAAMKRWQAIYVHYGPRGADDMTADVSCHLGIFYAATTLAYCLTTTSLSSEKWWPFWTALIIYGSFQLFYVILSVVCLRVTNSQASVASDFVAESGKAGANSKKDEDEDQDKDDDKD